MVGHIERAEHVEININGVRTRLRRGPAVLLTEFVDGEYHGDPTDPRYLRVIIRHGWALRTRGRYRLTPAGQEAHAAVTAYYARKQAALAQEQDRT